MTLCPHSAVGLPTVIYFTAEREKRPKSENIKYEHFAGKYGSNGFIK